MVMRKGGSRRKTRDKLKKDRRRRGKVSISTYFERYVSGDRVNLVLEPSIHKGMPHGRFCMKSGLVTGKRGFCYEVKINDRGKEKTLIVHPVHLKRTQ